MRNTKGQIQLMETIFIVIFIILIIVFSIVFFSQAEGEELRDKQKKFRDLDSITASQYVASLTELECSSYGTRDLSCIDKTKVISFAKLKDENWDLIGEYYVSVLGPATINISQVYPTKESWMIYDYTAEFSPDYYDEDASPPQHPYNPFSGRQIQIPVSLLDPMTKERSFGVIYLTIYDRVI